MHVQTYDGLSREWLPSPARLLPTVAEICQSLWQGDLTAAICVGPRPGAHGRLGLEGPATVDLLAQRGRGSDEQVAELAQRGAR